jgi:hypothetical protein
MNNLYCACASSHTLSLSDHSSHGSNISQNSDQMTPFSAIFVHHGGGINYAHIGTWISAHSFELTTNPPQQLHISSARGYSSPITLPLYTCQGSDKVTASPTLCRYRRDYKTVPVNEKLVAEIILGIPTNDVT